MRNPVLAHQHPIGIFDSGVGGLTVMQQILHRLPNEDTIYFGDTARLPYGEKSPETVTRFAIENSIFLMEHNVKVMVIACNTVCAHALHKLQQVFNIPIVGTIDPGAERAAKVTKNGRIAVLATRGTVKTGAYQSAIQKRLPEAEVISIACPLFVPLVEEMFVSHPATKIVVQEYLRELHEQNVDTVLLGCTHYPLLRNLIEEEMGPSVTVVDSAITCAEKVEEMLGEYQLHNDKTSSIHKYFVSDDPEKFRKLGKQFLGMPLNHVEAATSHLSNSQR